MVEQESSLTTSGVQTWHKLEYVTGGPRSLVGEIVLPGSVVYAQLSVAIAAAGADNRGRVTDPWHTQYCESIP